MFSANVVREYATCCWGVRVSEQGFRLFVEATIPLCTFHSFTCLSFQTWAWSVHPCPPTEQLEGSGLIKGQALKTGSWVKVWTNTVLSPYYTVSVFMFMLKVTSGLVILIQSYMPVCYFGNCSLNTDWVDASWPADLWGCFAIYPSAVLHTPSVLCLLACTSLSLPLIPNFIH